MIKLYICFSVLIIGSVEVGPDMDMKFHQEVMEIVSYDTNICHVDFAVTYLDADILFYIQVMQSVLG